MPRIEPVAKPSGIHALPCLGCRVNLRLEVSLSPEFGDKSGYEISTLRPESRSITIPNTDSSISISISIRVSISIARSQEFPRLDFCVADKNKFLQDLFSALA